MQLHSVYFVKLSSNMYSAFWKPWVPRVWRWSFRHYCILIPELWKQISLRTQLRYFKSLGHKLVWITWNSVHIKVKWNRHKYLLGWSYPEMFVISTPLIWLKKKYFKEIHWEECGRLLKFVHWTHYNLI